MNATETLPRLLWRNAELWPHRPAWRHKRLGIWQTLTWSGFAARVADIALGLTEEGLAPGDRLVVFGDNRPDLYATLIAAQALGGIGVPLDPDADPAVLDAVLHEADAHIVVADTIEQAERVRPLADALPHPARVFCADASGLHRDDAWERQSLDALAAIGRGRALREPGAVAAAVSRGSPQDLALLLYTPDAGRKSELPLRPTGLSHAQLISAAAAIDAVDPVRPSDNALSYLPMSSYEDTVYSLTLGLLGGFACNCPETPDSALRDLREIGPTILFAPPAACVALTQLVATKAAAVAGVKRRIFTYFQRLALQAEVLREQAEPVPFALATGCWFGELLAYGAVRDQLGLNRARWVRAGGSVPAESRRLLRGFGIALRPGLDCPVAEGIAGEPRETARV